MTGSPRTEYVLGTDRTELARLGLQHQLWAPTTQRLWELAGVRTGSRVLDVGCGPGYGSADLARLVGPAGAVVGVDESEGFVAELNHRAKAMHADHLTGLVGDVQRLDDALTDRHTGFDMVFARWVLCFVKDPARVIRDAARRLAPGGRFALFDYYNYAAFSLAPREPLFAEVIAAVERSWRDRGGDPDVMGRLPAVLRDEGFRVDHLQTVARSARPGEPMWDWPASFWDSFLPRLVRTGYLTEERHAAFTDLWRRASEDPARFVALPPVWILVASRA